MIKLTQGGKYKHDTRKVCFLCKKPFFEDAKNNYIKVRDHCRYTGKYRGAAHKISNRCIILQWKYQLYFIMVLVLITTS